MQTGTIRVQASLVGGGCAPAEMAVTAKFSEGCAEWHWALVMGSKPSTWRRQFSTQEEAYEAAADFLEGTVPPR